MIATVPSMAFSLYGWKAKGEVELIPGQVSAASQMLRRVTGLQGRYGRPEANRVLWGGLSKLLPKPIRHQEIFRRRTSKANANRPKENSVTLAGSGTGDCIMDVSSKNS